MYYKNDHKYEMTFLLLDNAIIVIGNETFLKMLLLNGCGKLLLVLSFKRTHLLNECVPALLIKMESYLGFYSFYYGYQFFSRH